VLIVWQFIMLPSIDLDAPVFANLVSVAYPGGDVLLLAALGSLLLLPRRGALPRGLFWVAGAFLLFVIADLAYSVAESAGSYSTGSWMDPLWPLAYSLIGAAGLCELTEGRRATAPMKLSVSAIHENTLRDQVRTAVPYAAAPVAIFLILWAQASEGTPAYLHTTGPMVAGILLLALVLARQSVTMLERNQLQGSLISLSHDLENRVEQRTNELSLLNRVAVTMSQCGSSKQVVEHGLRLAQEAFGCEAVGLSLQGPGQHRRFFGAPGLTRTARRHLSQAYRQVFSGDGEVEMLVDKPAVVDKVAVIPLVSRQTALGGLCLAPWEDTDQTSEMAGGKGNGTAPHSGNGRPQLELASAMAAQIAVAFENARRFEDAHYLAHRDPVTGLLNHRGMNERLEQELARCQRISSHFSVVMMDMDNFKLFNDTYGHAVGDEVLVKVAKVLSQAVRKYDVVARYGGDEFVALLPDTNSDGALVLVKRLRAAVKERAFFLEKKTLNKVPIVLSYGIATFPHQGTRVAEVMSAADANLYKSKSKGGDWITAPSPSITHRPNTKLGVFNVLDGLVTTVDNKDHYTRHHSDDVCGHSVALAVKMGLSADHQRVLRTAAILHDVGKIGVPDAVLRKPGSLTNEEFDIIKQHVVLSKLIIKEIPDLDEVLAAVATHHERYDGVGYPDGLMGNQIPLLGRILAVTDAYSAMTTDRPYRRALTATEALAELKRVAGKQLDPELVPLFCEVIEEEQSQLATVRMTVG
jgi:diguanylate cyclase (GGDEF)-like protein